MTESQNLTHLERFIREYAVPQTDLARQVELEVFGEINGSNGYTTVEQANQLAQQLDLGPPDRLLELGSGRGWPGTYLAEQSGCRAVLTDVPVDALKQAGASAAQRNLGARCSFVAADGRALPFNTRSFDRIVHTDLLC